MIQSVSSSATPRARPTDRPPQLPSPAPTAASDDAQLTQGDDGRTDSAAATYGTAATRCAGVARHGTFVADQHPANAASGPSAP